MLSRRFSIKRVVELTGLEESEVRYYESVFKEFLTFTQMGMDDNEFNEDHIEILNRIKSLIHKRGFSVVEVKKELKLTLKPFRAKSSTGLPPSKPSGYARVIAVTSGKGGVGKTAIAANLAICMAQEGKRVAIFDADLGLANIHILLGVKPRFNLSHVIQDDFSLDDILVQGPAGIKIISGGQGIREMANLQEEQRRVLLRQMDALEREVDVMIVDTGAGISENVLRFATFADEVMVVSTPNIAASADAFSIIKIMLEMEPNSKVGFLVNMVENQYHSRNVFNRVNTAVRKYLKYSLGYLGYVVYDHHMQASNQIRRPLMFAYPESPSARCISNIVDTILRTEVFVNRRKESSFQDLMGALRRTMAEAS